MLIFASLNNGNKELNLFRMDMCSVDVFLYTLNNLGNFLFNANKPPHTQESPKHS